MAFEPAEASNSMKWSKFQARARNGRRAVEAKGKVSGAAATKATSPQTLRRSGPGAALADPTDEKSHACSKI